MIQEGYIALKGNLIYAESRDKLITIPGGYIVYKDNVIDGVYPVLPESLNDITVYDYKDQLILPGLVDLHTHAPQYSFLGLSMDLELIEWLNQNTFPEEAKYSDLNYAKEAYSIFTEDLKKSATTRACIFGTVHEEATRLLMDLCEDTGLKCMVGKVNMDRNCPDYLIESVSQSIEDTITWIEKSKSRYQNVLPILTPRFLPSCTDDLMRRLSDIQQKYNLPVQSHLSENLAEIAWVKELCPKAINYGDAYNQFGLFGKDVKTIMAHCVYSTEEEVELMEKNGVYVAHCPDSNTNLSSGIAPIRKYLDRNLNVGLGTDMAGGNTISIFKTIVSAIQVSKLRWRLVDQSLKPLTVLEAFYLGTMGGGAFFGKVGSFQKGYEMDAIIIDDKKIRHPQPLTLKERLERVIYLSNDEHITAKYVAGKNILGIEAI